MAFEVREVEGRELVFSEKLAARGVPHAFGTRRGGVSQGACAGANMSFFGVDDPAAVKANWDGMLRRSGLGGARLRLLKQVHGTEVVEEPAGPDCALADPGQAPTRRADGLATDAPGVALGVITADCVPALLYFAAREGEPARVAALHCGWRGSVAGILPRFLARVGRAPDVVALGPHIRRDRFEVGPEVVPLFEEAFARTGRAPPPGALRAGEGDRVLADLEALLVAQLESAGVASEALETGAPCTYSDPGRFFSYRRDGAGRGLLGHVIGVPDPEGRGGAP